MRTPCLAVLIPAFVVGCAAPDPIDVEVPVAEPTVNILFPVSDDPLLPVDIELTPDCMVEQLVVVDIDGLELVPPNSDGATDAQGHIHITFEDDYEPVYTESYTYVRGPVNAQSPFASPGTQELRVTLQANDHSDLDQFGGWESIVEYKIVDNFDCF